MFWEKLIQKNIHFFCQRVSFNSKIIHSKEIPANSFKKNIHFFENWRIGQGYDNQDNFLPDHFWSLVGALVGCGWCWRMCKDSGRLPLCL